jgi:hypothetical protein
MSGLFTLEQRFIHLSVAALEQHCNLAPSMILGKSHDVHVSEFYEFYKNCLLYFDGCLRPTLAIFQLNHGVNSLKTVENVFRLD